jgi:ankyrin repeat protein
MPFSWRRIRNQRDELGHHAHAPEYHQNTLPFTLSPHDWTTPWGAAFLGYTRILARMKKQGVSLDSRDDTGATPLWYAVTSEQQDHDTIAWLLANDSDPNRAAHDGTGPLHRAILQKNKPLVRFLLQSGASPNGEEGSLRPPLFDAVRLGDVDIAGMLLRAGADIDKRDGLGQSMLFILPPMKFNAVLPLLLSYGVSVRARNHEGDTVLHQMLRRGEAKIFRALLPPDDESDYLALLGRDGDTLLHAAAEGGNPILVRFLLGRGRNPEATNALGHTPLLVALTEEHLPAATLLTKTGIEIRFLEAIALGDAERARDLPTQSTVLDHLIRRQETPLMGAIARGRPDLVEILLERGARLDAISPSVGTALDVAILTKQPEMVRLLVRYGAKHEHLRAANAEQMRRVLRDAQEGISGISIASAQERPSPAEVYDAACESEEALRWMVMLGGSVPNALAFAQALGETENDSASESESVGVRRLEAMQTA